VILPVPHKTVEGGSPRDAITEWDETIANGTISRLDELALAFDKPVVKELIGLGFAAGMVKECVMLTSKELESKSTIEYYYGDRAASPSSSNGK